MKRNVMIAIAAALLTLGAAGYALASKACCVEPQSNSCCNTTATSQCCR